MEKFSFEYRMDYIEDGFGFGLKDFADEISAFFEEVLGQVHDCFDAGHDVASIPIEIAWVDRRDVKQDGVEVAIF